MQQGNAPEKKRAPVARSLVNPVRFIGNLKFTGRFVFVRLSPQLKIFLINLETRNQSFYVNSLIRSNYRLYFDLKERGDL